MEFEFAAKMLKEMTAENFNACRRRIFSTLAEVILHPRGSLIYKMSAAVPVVAGKIIFLIFTFGIHI